MLIYQQSGEPPKHLPLFEAGFHIAPAVSSFIRLNDTTADHTVRLQIISIHYLGVFEAERIDTSLPK
jgi:hypothetical protein